MAPLPHDQDITSWPQLLSAIEDAEAGRETARLSEICLSVYGALAAAQFQITQLRARVHALAANGASTAIPSAGARLPAASQDQMGATERTPWVCQPASSMSSTRSRTSCGSPISTSRAHSRPSPDSPETRATPVPSG